MTLIKAILFVLSASALPHAAQLKDLSSDQRVKHFERFIATRPPLASAANDRHGPLIKVWLRAHAPAFKAHAAEQIPEFFDLYLRRCGAFNQDEALEWVAGRLIGELNRAPRPYSAATRATLRMYTDVALAFTAAPISRRLTQAVDGESASVAWSRDAVAYHLWRNPRMKQFIARVARDVPTAPKKTLARARWFLAPYSAPCPGLE